MSDCTLLFFFHIISSITTLIMKSTFTLAALSLFASQCLAASVDMWSAPLSARSAAKYEPIDPEVIKSRLGTTPEEHDQENRHPGMVGFNPAATVLTRIIANGGLGLLLP